MLYVESNFLLIFFIARGVQLDNRVNPPGKNLATLVHESGRRFLHAFFKAFKLSKTSWCEDVGQHLNLGHTSIIMKHLCMFIRKGVSRMSKFYDLSGI